MGPLGLPPPEVRREQAMRSAAVQLFIERATAARPSFTFDDEDLGRIVEVVRGLEGIPLAIELAAARASVLTPSQIADRLDDKFRLRAPPLLPCEPRHRTLEAAIGWSYELLTSSEQLLLQRLSIFAGGCTLEACERVVSGDGIDDFEVLDLLAALVERSLVVADTGGAQGRYRMLETIRRYAADRLAEVETRTAGGSAMPPGVEVCDLSPELADGYRAISDETLALFDREQDNLRAGFDWLVAGGDAERALRMITGLGWFWYIRGYWIEGTDGPSPPSTCRLQSPTWSGRGRSPSFPSSPSGGDRRLGSASRRGGAGARPQARGPGTDCLLDDDLRSALYCSRSLREGVRPRRGGLPDGYRGWGDASGGVIAVAHGTGGFDDGRLRRLDRAPAGVRAALRINRRTWGWRPRSSVRANGALGLGRLDEAKDMLERSMAKARTIGALDELGPSLLALGYITLVHGDEEGARRSPAGWEDIRSRRDWGGALAVGIVAQFLALVGRQAQALLEGLLEMAKESARPQRPGGASVGLAWFGVLSGDVAEAARRAAPSPRVAGRPDGPPRCLQRAHRGSAHPASLRRGRRGRQPGRRWHRRPRRRWSPLRTIERTLLGTLPGPIPTRPSPLTPPPPPGLASKR